LVIGYLNLVIVWTLGYCFLSIMSSHPSLTISQTQDLDQILVSHLGLPVMVLMENAGRHAAELARQMLGKSINNKKIIILCGTGNNAGDGMVAGRYLHNLGANILVILTSDVTILKKEPKLQAEILAKMQVNIKTFGENNFELIKKQLRTADLIIDALLGFGSVGDPREPAKTLINLANQTQTKILAVDLPSGLNADTGIAGNPTIKANSTITLALPKVGLIKPEAHPWIGDLYVADIGVPRIAYEKLGIDVGDWFRDKEIVKI